MMSSEKIFKCNAIQREESFNLPFRGVVSYLVPERNFGIIMTNDGLEIYFLRSSMLGNAFEKLEPGERVKFNLIHGILGLQARLVMAASNQSIYH